MKEKVGQLKEAIQKLESRTKKIIIAGVAILIVGAVALALVLNNRPYEVLFSVRIFNPIKQTNGGTDTILQIIQFIRILVGIRCHHARIINKCIIRKSGHRGSDRTECYEGARPDLRRG